MEQKKDNPGVYIPPPLLYVAVFFLSILFQRLIPVVDIFLQSHYTNYLFYIFLLAALCFLLPSLLQFLNSRNTLITIKPANSLQTSGIYALTRNPMYTGLLMLYTAIAFKLGTPWTFIFIPLVIVVITRFVILKEEK